MARILYPFVVILALASAVTPVSADAVIALDTDGGTKQLSYLAGDLDRAELAALQALAPNVNFVVGLSDEEAVARAEEFEGADAHVLSEEFLAAASNLRWVQSWSAGVDGYLKLDGLRNNEQIVLTNMQGVHGPVISEHVFAMLLSLTRKLPELGEAQRDQDWDRSRAQGATSLAGRTIFVVGMGGIGSQVARRADAFDMTVLATVRNPEGRALPDYVDELGGTEDLDRFLALADVVVVTLPLTDETRGLFDAAPLCADAGWILVRQHRPGADRGDRRSRRGPTQRPSRRRCAGRNGSRTPSQGAPPVDHG